VRLYNKQWISTHRPSTLSLIFASPRELVSSFQRSVAHCRKWSAFPSETIAVPRHGGSSCAVVLRVAQAAPLLLLVTVGSGGAVDVSFFSPSRQKNSHSSLFSLEVVALPRTVISFLVPKSRCFYSPFYSGNSTFCRLLHVSVVLAFQVSCCRTLKLRIRVL